MSQTEAKELQNEVLNPDKSSVIAGLIKTKVDSLLTIICEEGKVNDVNSLTSLFEGCLALYTYDHNPEYLTYVIDALPGYKDTYKEQVQIDTYIHLHFSTLEAITSVSNIRPEQSKSNATLQYFLESSVESVINEAYEHDDISEDEFNLFIARKNEITRNDFAYYNEVTLKDIEQVHGNLQTFVNKLIFNIMNSSDNITQGKCLYNLSVLTKKLYEAGHYELVRQIFSRFHEQFDKSTILSDFDVYTRWNEIRHATSTDEPLYLNRLLRYDVPRNSYVIPYEQIIDRLLNEDRTHDAWNWAHKHDENNDPITRTKALTTLVKHGLTGAIEEAISSLERSTDYELAVDSLLTMRDTVQTMTKLPTNSRHDFPTVDAAKQYYLHCIDSSIKKIIYGQNRNDWSINSLLSRSIINEDTVLDEQKKYTNLYNAVRKLVKHQEYQGQFFSDIESMDDRLEFMYFCARYQTGEKQQDSLLTAIRSHFNKKFGTNMQYALAPVLIEAVFNPDSFKTRLTMLPKWYLYGSDGMNIPDIRARVFFHQLSEAKTLEEQQKAIEIFQVHTNKDSYLDELLVAFDLS